MKKIITSLFALCIISFSTVFSAHTIVDYNESHKNAVMEIAFQDPYKFFCGSHLVHQKMMAAEQFESMNRTAFEAALNETLRVKKVLITEDGKVIGFVSFFKSQEKSLESAKRTIEAQGFPFDEAQVLALMPHIKKTDAECEQFAFIEAVAISKESRGKGYGKMLTQEAELAIAQKWPTLKKIQLNVNEDNEIARKLYEAAGYKVATNQPTGMAMMKAVQYEKSL